LSDCQKKWQILSVSISGYKFNLDSIRGNRSAKTAKFDVFCLLAGFGTTLDKRGCQTLKNV